MKVATAAYPLDWFSDWAGYEAKMRAWVTEAAGQGAELRVFPEFGAMERASRAGREAAADPNGSIRAVSERLAAANAVLAALAQEFGVYILGGSAPLEEGGKVVNRAPFFAPSGVSDYQDKQILTRFERDDWGLVGAAPLKVFDTALGRIGVLICYDSEFPLLGRALVEAGVEVSPIPGPSAVVTLLSVSGLPTDRFIFEGFLPLKGGKKKRRLEGLIGEERTMIFYESPHRTSKTLALMLEVFGDRRAALGREMTKVFEEVARGRLSDLCARFDGTRVRGEITLAVAGSGED